MSVIVIGRFAADQANVERLWQERPADVESVSAEAKTVGCTRHQWGFADGQVLLVDEWPDQESFLRFFGANQTIPELMAAVDVKGEPSFEFFELKQGPDSF